MKNMKALWFNCNIMGLGLLILLLFSLKTALGGTIVKSLPGYGDLPFTLETGYVGVGENEELQLFYYFVESESSPEKDPLMLWIPEGPGCTSLAPFFFGKGPLRLDTINYIEGLLPNLLPNPFAWTQGLNVIFLDAPVGTGFSYSKTSEGYNNVGDFSFANNTYEFLLKWLQNHTEFSKNQLYVAGEGYAGNIVPLVIDKILNGNQDINIKGYVLGNPGTDKITDFNAQTTIAYRLGLVPERLYQEAYKSCDNGNFTMENPTANCSAYNDIITQLISGINMPNILQPTCSDLSTLTLKEQTDDYSTRRHLKQESIDFQADAQEKQSVVNPALSCVLEPSCSSLFTLTLKEQTDDISTGRHLKERSRDFLNLQANAQETQCASFTQMVCEKWANDTNVQEALHVEKGTITSWSYCSNNPNYTTDVTTVIDYHRNFTTIDLQALIYSGDHDMAISYIGTEEWIWTLDLPLVESWSPWSIDNEVAGFTRRFTNDSRYNLTFATVKGAGHFAAQDKPRECFKMVQRWMVNGTLSLNLS